MSFVFAFLTGGYDAGDRLKIWEALNDVHLLRSCFYGIFTYWRVICERIDRQLAENTTPDWKWGVNGALLSGVNLKMQKAAVKASIKECLRRMGRSPGHYLRVEDWKMSCSLITLTDICWKLEEKRGRAALIYGLIELQCFDDER